MHCSRLLLCLCCLINGLLVADEVEPLIHWHPLPPIPDPVGLAGGFAGVSRGRLIFAGGANFPQAPPWEGGEKVWHDAVYTLRPGDSDWQRASAVLPAPRAYGISASWRGQVVCAGGSDDQHHYSDVFLLRLEKDNVVIETLPSLPVPIANATGALVDDTLFIVGGSHAPAAATASKAMYGIDLSQRGDDLAWRSFAPLPGAGRILAGCAVVGDRFYVFGGAELLVDEEETTTRRFLKDGFVYDTSSDRWAGIADAPQPICAPPIPAFTINDDVFLTLGGDDGTLFHQPPLHDEHPGFSKTQFVYDRTRDAWRQEGSFPRAIPFDLGPHGNAGTWPPVTAPTAMWNGAYTILSGEARPGVRTPKVWAATRSESATYDAVWLWGGSVAAILGILLLVRRYASRGEQ